jgi:hypothetical protein
MFNHIDSIVFFGNNGIKAVINDTTILLRYELNPLCPHITQCYNHGKEFGGINSKIYDYNTNQLVSVIYCDSSVDEDILIYKSIPEIYIYIPEILSYLVDFYESFDPYFHYNIDFEYNENNELHYDLFNNKLH